MSPQLTTPYTVDLYDGLKALGDHVRIEEQTAEYYLEYVQAQYRAGLCPGMIAEPELPDALCEKARAFADTALIAISRFSGEGWDPTGHWRNRTGSFLRAGTFICPERKRR